MRSVLKLQIGAVVLIVIAIVVFFVMNREEEPMPVVEEAVEEVVEPEPIVVDRVIGTSVEGRDIGAVTFGDGATHLLFVGGVHGGYEWNSVLLAYQMIDYFDTNPDSIPAHVSVSIIPSLNPDGLYEIVGSGGRFALADVPATKDATIPGRFNANDVDLNRNFGCKWAPESTWRGKTVSAGTEAFSEPEAAALRDFVLETKPEAVIFWHSQANTVYASECHEGVLPETVAIMHAYADAAEYNKVEKFDAYEITGDAEGWLASINIPAITVELNTHETIEFNQNLAGVNALFSHYTDLAR